MAVTHDPLLRELRRLATERWARRALRTLLQAASMAIGVWCIGLGASLLWRWPVDLKFLTAASLVILAIALATLLRRPMPPAEVARRLDRRFHLNEQLATAVEVVHANEMPSPVAERLIERSARTVGGVHQYVQKRQKAPWSDILTFLALMIVAAGLLALSGIGGFRLDALATPLPALPSLNDPSRQFADEAPLPLPGGNQADAGGDGENLAQGSSATAGDTSQSALASQPSSAGADPQTLEALANAMRDQGATRPAAEALDRGDTAEAARTLRELADQADSLSQQSRQALADALRDAASDINRRDPALSSQLRDSARELEREQSAAQGLEDLAQAIDQLGDPAAESSASQPQSAAQSQGDPQNGQQTGEQPGQPGADGDPNGAGQQASTGSAAGNNPAGEQRPIAPAGRLGVEGQPVELEADGGGQNANGQNNPSALLQGSAGSTSGGQSGAGGAIGADPLRIPLDERDVVQGYFQP